MPQVLQVAQIVADTEAEGPGRRFAVWVQGCPMRCPGCCNPSFLRFEGGESFDPAGLAARVIAIASGVRGGVEGISLLGGEPFAQAEACAAFASVVRAAGLSVMVFSGFTRAELTTQRAQHEPGVGALLDACDLLVDGPYVREQPEHGRRWIGSTNQQMHFLTERYRADDPVFRSANTVEIRLRKGEMVVNGWPALAARVVRPVPRSR